jgi:hypothetical protein
MPRPKGSVNKITSEIKEKIADLLCYVVAGMIVSILYFTSIKKEFE